MVESKELARAPSCDTSVRGSQTPTKNGYSGKPVPRSPPKYVKRLAGLLPKLGGPPMEMDLDVRALVKRGHGLAAGGFGTGLPLGVRGRGRVAVFMRERVLCGGAAKPVVRKMPAPPNCTKRYTLALMMYSP